MHTQYVGQGTVELIAGGGRVYTDVAARFVQSERAVKDIVRAPYSRDVVRRIVESGHKAALEFDYFLFGVEGYSRVTEAQLIRKRLASFMIKSGRVEKRGKRGFSVVIPRSIEGIRATVEVSAGTIRLPDGRALSEVLASDTDKLTLEIGAREILAMVEGWYDRGVEQGVPEEDLRYLKPQATEFKAIIGMNAHALMDWFGIRCCRRAQAEIRDMAQKMLHLCREAAPDIFQDAGPNCRLLGYCPENSMQHTACRGRIATRQETMDLLRQKGYSEVE